jgi:hypothetical protein
MPLIRARSSSLIDSIDLRGSPTAPTAAAGTSTTQVATTAFVSSGITDLVNGAPGILDTLAELATSLGDDADFATTITNALAGKVAKAGDSMSGFLTLHADPSSNLHAATKQYVDGEINSITINSSDDVPEGSNNQYYLASRVFADLTLTTDNSSVFDYNSATGVFTYAHPTSDGVLEGSTNQYYTDARARGAVSLTSSDSTVLSYSSSTGAFTFTRQDTDKTTEGSTNLYFTTARARNSLSGGNNISYDTATGIISSTAAVTSVNGMDGVVVVGTDDVNEGSTNLYFTNARAQSAISLTSNDSNMLDYNSGTGAFTFVKPDTDGITEGTTNLYYTNTRVRNAISTSGWANLSYDSTTGVISISAPDTDDVTEGSNLYYTNTRARAAISVTDVSGDGSMSYDNTTGVITYTGPSASEVRAHLSATTASGITYDNTTGAFALATVPNSSLQNSSITINGLTINLGGNNSVTTTEVTEGTNLYYTQARFNTAFSAKDTGGLAEGSNLYYTQARFDTALAASDTGDLAEGTNLYFTDTRARNALVAGTGVTYTAGTGTIAIGQSVGTTDDVAFNNMTLAGNLTVNGTVTAVNSTTVDIADKNLTLAKGAANAAAANGAGVTIDGASATILYASGTDSWDFNKTVKGTFEGNITGDVTGDVTGTVSDISNHTTTDLAEGTSLYFTDARARSAISLVTSDSSVLAYDSATGVFTFSLANSNTDGVAEGSSNLYFTNTRARNAVSAVDAGGDGSFSYDSATGAFTYTGPSASEVRAHLSATSASGVTYDSATGAFALASIPNSSLTNNEITVNGYATALGATVTLDSDDVSEGSTNLYFTNARAAGAISLTSDSQSVLAYDSTTGTFTFTLANTTTDAVAEGSTNQYFTTARARNSISVSGSGTYDSATGIITVNGAVTSVNGATGVVVIGTDDVNEGSSNLYFTNARAQSAISLTSDDANILAYNSGTGAFTFNTPDTDAITEGAVNLYYTDTRADARLAAASVGDLSDVDLTAGLQDGYTLVWSSAEQNFVPQNIAVTATTLNFTGDGTETSFSTGVEVASIDNTQVFVNGLIQAPTYSYSITTASNVTSIVFTEAPANNDYIFVRVSSTSSLTAGGVLNEQSSIDGGTY